MAKTEAASGGDVRTRPRSIVTTVLLILISVMIVRDLLVRRWSGTAPPSQDTTLQSR
ncbi:hypothetical protein [Bradyrhizobium centrolobii]|uniref:hypothetical protein n=1 Tax=Bradyrhizobium centrolobii TaxID=1505087 RepID=UPI000A6C2C06|nr:hypothetical protein [Bradyrhizobium centrolobii]